MTLSIDKNSPKYQELLEERILYKEYKELYPHMKWALKTLDRLENRNFLEAFNFYERLDFLKAKTIIDFVIEEKAKETADKHSTPKYKWRTRGDGKVRSRHAKFNGQIFSWDSPPEGGYHPGEDWGCRCTAEPYGLSSNTIALPRRKPEKYSERDMSPKSPKNTRVSKIGVEIIAQHESFRTYVYNDSAGYPTIGYGHKLKPKESFPNGISHEEALKLYREDLSTAGNAVSRHVDTNLAQPQFDALTSFTYNVGAGAFRKSTLLKKINEGDLKGAANEFSKWTNVTVNGVLTPSNGLANRRKSEEELFRIGLPK